MIPKSLGQITPEYLTNLLRQRYPDASVTAVTVHGEIHGTASKALLILDGTGDFPRRMWLQAGWEPHRAVMATVGIYAREPRVYAELLPDLAVVAPRCHGATWDDAELEGVVLLEDLAEAGATIHSPQSAVPVDEVAAMLAMLANMHGTTAAPAFRASRPWLHPLFHDTSDPDGYLNYVSKPETLEGYLAMPRGDAMPVEARDAGKIAAAFKKTTVWGRDDTNRTVIHGDAHIGNSYRTADGRPGLLDWQCVWWGGCMFDTTYYLASALSVPDRRANEAALLEDYRQQLAAAGGPNYTSDGLLEAYRNYLAYGMTVWLTNSTNFQPEDFNAIVAPRFAQALVDHELI